MDFEEEESPVDLPEADELLPDFPDSLPDAFAIGGKALRSIISSTISRKLDFAALLLLPRRFDVLIFEDVFRFVDAAERLLPLRDELPVSEESEEVDRFFPVEREEPV